MFRDSANLSVDCGWLNRIWGHTWSYILSVSIFTYLLSQSHTFPPALCSWVRWLIKSHMWTAALQIESRRESSGGRWAGLSKEASPEEIKSREVVRESWTSASVVSQRRSYGHCTKWLFCIAVGTAATWCCDRGALGLPGWRLFQGFTLLSPFPIANQTLSNRQPGWSFLINVPYRLDCSGFS